MRLLLLSDSNSPHTIKWATSLAKKNVEVLIFSIAANTTNSYNDYNNIKIVTAGVSAGRQFKGEADTSKLSYISSIYKIKKIINEFKPDILHAHYATSYGLLGALSGFHPFIISVWGTDIISFPKISFLHRKLLHFNLNKADRVLATSKYLANETARYTSQKIEVTPFGIDVDKFQPCNVNSIFSNDELVIGTIKRMEETYGIEYLIKAFNIVKEKNEDKKLKLLLVGEGLKINYYKTLVEKLGIESDVVFTGKIQYDEIAKYHNMIDIPVYISIYESFGVSVLESGACEKAVIVSNVGGLPEIVENNKTGLIVEPGNIQQTADAIERLIGNEELRKTLGINGRKKVQEEYNWEDNLEKMVCIYEETIKNKSEVKTLLQNQIL